MAEGDAAAEIVAHARDLKVDLIMMPTRGPGPLRKFLLGSVTAKVLHDTDIPVWTGAHTAEPGAPPAHHYRRILSAADIEPKEAPVLQWATAFAQKENAEVRLVHAVPDAKSRNGDDDPPVREELFKLAHQGIDALQKSAGTACQVTIRAGKPELVIHNAVGDLGADLVVVGRGGIRGVLGRLRSHAYSIIRQSPCPVISV